MKNETQQPQPLPPEVVQEIKTEKDRIKKETGDKGKEIGEFSGQAAVSSTGYALATFCLKGLTKGNPAANLAVGIIGALALQKAEKTYGAPVSGRAEKLGEKAGLKVGEWRANSAEGSIKKDKLTLWEQKQAAIQERDAKIQERDEKIQEQDVTIQELKKQVQALKAQNAVPTAQTFGESIILQKEEELAEPKHEKIAPEMIKSETGKSSGIFSSPSISKEYDLALISIKGDVNIKEILKENKELLQKPILFKEGDRFSIYGLSPKGEWQLTKDLDADKLKELKFDEKPKILSSNQVPKKVYEEITLKKGHALSKSPPSSAALPEKSQQTVPVF
jgi:hypothetical protein